MQQVDELRESNDSKQRMIEALKQQKDALEQMLTQHGCKLSDKPDYSQQFALPTTTNQVRHSLGLTK